MISYLKGTIQHKGNGFVIVLIRDIGYKVFVNTALYSDLETNKEAAIYIHHHVREDAVNLYGFRNMAELEMFELLLSVSGIGPKTALAVLAAGTIEDIKRSIAHGDPGLLTKVSGIGKKTAERVVLELREKVGILGGGDGESVAGGDEIDALVSLGYSLSDAREALRGVDKNIKDSGQKIKEALKKLSR